jgi:hypothetical protein
VLVGAQVLNAPAWVGLLSTVAAVVVAAGLRVLGLASGHTLPQWSTGDTADR